MNILLHPTYFPSVAHFVVILRAEKIIFEVEDNFQRQTNRNRTYIYGSNGKQLLNIPIKHSQSTHQKYKDVRIDYSENWQKRHYKSLETAYRSSPFFEYFEDDLLPLFECKPKFLLDYNFELFEILQTCMNCTLVFEKTIEYGKSHEGIEDFRYLVDGKKIVHYFEPYTQVFAEKHGFINDLSILDVLFNQGKHTLAYLKRQNIEDKQ